MSFVVFQRVLPIIQSIFTIGWDKSSMTDDSLDGISRRNFVRTAGAGALAALAGCSNEGGGEGSTDSGSNYTETSEEPSTTDQEGTATGTEEESSGESSIINGEDEVHDGEEFYEGFLDEEFDFHWIELEHPSSQTENVAEANSMTEENDFRYIELMLTENKSSVDGNPNNTVALDTLYIAFPGEESDVDSQFSLTGLVESEYNEGEGFGQSNGQYGARVEDVTLEEIEGFLDEQVTGYSDLSDNLPDEYQDLISE